MFRLLRLISYPQLRTSWGRTLLVAGGISTGVTLIVAINIINSSVLANFRDTIDLMAGPAALEVTLGIGEVGFSESVVETVRRDPDVAAAVPLVRGTISLVSEPGETLQLFGADLVAEEDLRRYRVTTATDRRELLRVMEDPHSILLTTTFAMRHHLAVGQMTRFTTPGGIADFTVRGLLETEGLAAAFGGQLAVMDLPAAQDLLTKESRVDQVDIILRPGADVVEVQRRLQSALPSTLSVTRPAQRGAQYEHVLASFQAMLTGISTVCLIAGLFIIYNTTSTGAAQRAPVIAGLRLIGAEASQLFRLIMLEALMLGVVGTLSGVATGIIMARLLSGMVADSMAVIYKIHFAVPQLAIDWPQQATIGALGVATALFACYFAARRLAELDPLAVLRMGAPAAAARPRMARLMVWWVALIVTSAAALFAQERFRSILWGNVGASLWNASVMLVAVPLVGWLAGGLRTLLPRIFPSEGRVVADSLLRSPNRTGVTVAAIALTVTISIMLTSLSVSFRDSAADYIGQLFAADLVVSAVTNEGGYLETPLPESIASEIQALPGVRAVESGRALPGQVFRGQRIGVLALSDGFFDPGRYPAHWYREGDPERARRALRTGEGVNVSTTLADSFDLHVGDAIELDTPAGKLVRPIVGVVPDYISDRGSVILSRRLFVEYWREPTVTRINIYLEPGESLEKARSAIASHFSARYLLKALSLREVLEYHDEYRRRAFAFTDAIQLLIVMVTVAGIFDLLFSAILERRRELGLWQLVGADERTVRRSIVIESATIGMMGATLGVAVGFITAWIWVRLNFRYLLGYQLQFRFPAGHALWCLLLVLATTILTGYVASLRATRARLLDSLRIE